MKVYKYVLPKMGEVIEIPAFPPGAARIVQVERTGTKDGRGYSLYDVWIEVANA